MAHRIVQLGGQVVEADLTWTGEKFQRGIRIRCDSNGKIVEMGTHIPASSVTQRLEKRALLPGMINAHSHAFHRGLRVFKEGPAQDGNFWTWRANMYRMVTEYSKQQFYDVSRQAFEEMLLAGITTVGEFHYWHHSCPRIESEESNENVLYDMDSVILRAAKDANIRIVLLETFYEQAGLKQQPLEPAQHHFVTPNVEEFVNHCTRLRMTLDPHTQTLGLAAHSIRAVKLENIVRLWNEAIVLDVPFHIHLEEQPAEIAQTKEVFAKTPSALLLERLTGLNSRFTAVHCTHTPRSNIGDLLSNGANVCLAPLTEGRLGDGLFPWPTEGSPLNLCLGTDCNNRICMAEEMRWLLYSQQMKAVVRGFPHGVGFDTAARLLFSFVTTGGARSLGLSDSCGRLAPGFYLDGFLLDLDHVSVKWAKKSTLLDAFVFGGASDALVAATCVGGVMKVYRDVTATSTISMPRSMSTTMHLDASTPLSFLMSVMQFDSTTGKEGPVGEALAQFLESEGWTVAKSPLQHEKARVNLLATRSKHAKPKLILNAHQDTVPPHIPPRFDRETGILYGRGACDAQGSVAAMFFAAKEFIHKYPAYANDIGLLYVVGEEVDHIGAKEAGAFGLAPAFFICGEPTENQLAKGQKGFLKVRLSLKGKAAHSGYPHLGQCALTPLLDVLADLRSTKWPSNHLGDTNMNIGLLNAGQAANVIPASAEATIAFRVVTSPEEVLQMVEQVVAGRTQIERISGNPPLDLHIVPGLGNIVVPFNTDLYYTPLPESCKKLLIGPGAMTCAHGPDEQISVADLNEGVRVLVQLMETLLL